MFIPYEFENCVVCRCEPPGDTEHIIPQALGGRLNSRILCDTCNHTFGSELVSRVKTDPTIVSAVNNLKDALPKLYESFQKDKFLIGGAEDDSSVRVKRVGDSMRIFAEKKADGSIVLGTPDATKALEKKLARKQLSPDEIDKWRKRFEEIPEFYPLRIPTGEVFIKRPIGRLRPQIHGESLDDRLPVLIAFEYLGILIGNLILEDRFNFVRENILDGSVTERIMVENYFACRKYSPFHAIQLVPDLEAVRIDIRFFRSIVYVVTIRGISIEGLDPIYYEDLGTKQSCFSPSVSDFKQGKMFCL